MVRSLLNNARGATVLFFLNASPVRHSNKRRVVGFDLRQDRAERKSVPYRRHGGHSRHRPKRFRFHMPSLSPPFLCFVDIVAAPRDRTPPSIETNRRIGFGRWCFLMVNCCLVHANRKFESSHLDGGMTDSTRPYGGILESTWYTKKLQFGICRTLTNERGYPTRRKCRT